MFVSLANGHADGLLDVGLDVEGLFVGLLEVGLADLGLDVGGVFVGLADMGLDDVGVFVGIVGLCVGICVGLQLIFPSSVLVRLYILSVGL